MKMNKNTVLYIIAFSVVIFILIFISSRPTNEKIGMAEENRKTRNALQEIIDSDGWIVVPSVRAVSRAALHLDREFSRLTGSG